MNDPAPPRRQPRFTRYAQPATDVAAGIVAGLRGEPPSIAPRYFYDALGSRLFEAICELPEYYPTRTEAAIFAEHGRQIAAAAGPGCTLIDLGAGDCEKAARLFDLMQPAQYAALDISADFLRERLDCLQDRFPLLDIIGVALDFVADLQLPPSVAAARRLFFYPGSSIGNFTPDEACAFLQRVQRLAGAGGQLLIGVDLVKPAPILDAAYDDALGVTAAFNRNVLNHVNRLAGTDFDIRDWRHVAFFDAVGARIEMHLEARRDVIVRIPGGAPLRLAAGARIHTENSWKYTVDGFEALLRAAGFAQTRCWTDPRGWFALFLARA
ncbi:MAG: L-histidine N(alpha)-methyltransferase [Burkholderiaceae bacterium]|jgi:dimethylhistidine N-methyltransferase|nr:L-histidine N(alpha)-methyltransferase [Burkholderiaceae bacterium]